MYIELYILKIDPSSLGQKCHTKLSKATWNTTIIYKEHMWKLPFPGQTVVIINTKINTTSIETENIGSIRY